MRLLTWNVCFDERRFRDRTIDLMSAIVEGQYDVVALQEVTAPLRTVLGDFATRTGFTLHGGDGSPLGYDVAFLTRDREARFGTLPLPSIMGRRAISVTTADLTIATVHLESMPPYTATRVDQLQRIGAWLPPRAVLLGDLNYDDFDARECDALDDTFVDVWPLLHPKQLGPTCGKRRLDHVFVRNDVRATSIALVGNATISDHLGVAVEVQAAGTAWSGTR